MFKVSMVTLGGAASGGVAETQEQNLRMGSKASCPLEPQHEAAFTPADRCHSRFPHTHTHQKKDAKQEATRRHRTGVET